MRLSIIALAALLLATSQATAFGPDVPTQREYAISRRVRRPNRCRLEGDHVAGVVSVDMQNGTREQIPLIDVEATIAMAPSLADVVVYVWEPLLFEGRFVAHDLGGPAAHVEEDYRSTERGVQIAADRPFEITLAPTRADAIIHLLAPYGEGHVEITIPCRLLTAGAPSANMAEEAPPARRHVIAIRAGTRVTAVPFEGGPELALVVGDADPSASVSLYGRIRSHERGFARVAFAVGPATIEGFVPDASVVAVGEGTAPARATGGFTYTQRNVAGLARTLLLEDMPVYADATEESEWATVTTPFDVYVVDAPFHARRAVVADAIELRAHACRFDAVTGRPTCGDTRGLPRIGLARCTDTGCPGLFYIPPIY